MPSPEDPPGSARISPTAHYTGYVWARHDLGEPALATREGWLLHSLARPLLGAVDRLGGPTLEHFLLARHRIIDHLLAEELARGTVGTVVELAAGLSPRGLHLVRDHPGLQYVEVDLPGMAARKRQALARIGTDPSRHRVEAADVFSPDLEAVLAGLDADRGVAVVTEGLLNYFPTDEVRELWGRLAGGLGRFPHGVYLSDLHLHPSGRLLDQAFARVLGAVVRGDVHFHFDTADEAVAALNAAGFAAARLHAPADFARVLPGMTASGAGRVRVVQAATSTPG